MLVTQLSQAQVALIGLSGTKVSPLSGGCDCRLLISVSLQVALVSFSAGKVLPSLVCCSTYNACDSSGVHCLVLLQFCTVLLYVYLDILMPNKFSVVIQRTAVYHI